MRAFAGWIVAGLLALVLIAGLLCRWPHEVHSVTDASQTERQGEVALLGDWACSLCELRWLDLESINAPEDDNNAGRESLLEDRDGILKGIEELLGSENYKQFRDLGGIGLLNDVIDCPGDSSGP